jgi:hypothetical protein
MASVRPGPFQAALAKGIKPTMAQAFNLFNHANYYVQNGNGINQLQYNPIGTNCSDGTTLKQACYLVPNSGPGISEPCRKSAQTAFPACCSFQHGSLSRSLKDLPQCPARQSQHQ